MIRRTLLALAVASGGCNSQAAATRADAFPAVFRIVKPAVVMFSMRVPTGDPHKKGKFEDAYGTGIVVASGPWGSQILTVEHVVRDAREVKVTIAERRRYAVRIVARDEDNDLALVETPAPDLPVIRLGRSRGIEAGTAIGVAGYPIPDAFADEGLGVATSVYAGRISSVRKDALELDLPVIPGESGGPVFDAATGDVIGIAESRFEEERAIGFAIPIDNARDFLHAHARGF